MVQGEVPVECPVRYKNLKLAGINVDVRVDEQTMRVWVSSPNESVLKGHFKNKLKKRSPCEGDSEGMVPHIGGEWS